MINYLFKWSQPGFLALVLAAKATIFCPSISSYQVKDVYAQRKLVFPCFYHKDFYLIKYKILLNKVVRFSRGWGKASQATVF